MAAGKEPTITFVSDCCRDRLWQGCVDGVTPESHCWACLQPCGVSKATWRDRVRLTAVDLATAARQAFFRLFSIGKL